MYNTCRYFAIQL